MARWDPAMRKICRWVNATEQSLADAEMGENLTEQVIGGKFARNAGKRALRKSEFLRKQLKLGNAGRRLVNVSLRRLQRL